MDRITLRLEAARIAAQLGPQSAADLVKQSRAIEKYILGKAQLPEHVSIEEVVKMNIEEGMNAILKKEKAEMDDIGKRLDDAYECALKKIHDQGPCLGVDPFNGLSEHPESPATHDIAYLAPGGMPCADGEGIFLQQNVEKVE